MLTSLFCWKNGGRCWQKLTDYTVRPVPVSVHQESLTGVPVMKHSHGMINVVPSAKSGETEPPKKRLERHSELFEVIIIGASGGHPTAHGYPLPVSVSGLHAR